MLGLRSPDNCLETKTLLPQYGQEVEDVVLSTMISPPQDSQE